jgi:hypothetical protein
MSTRTFKSISVALLATPLLFTSCMKEFAGIIDGRGEIVESRLYAAPFSGIANTISADIYLSQGDEQHILVRAQENIIDNIRLEVVSGTWIVSYRHPVRFAKPVRIYVTVPKLKSVEISGSGSVHGETPFEGLDRLTLVISGSGSMDLAARAETMDMIISGSGNLLMVGQTGFLKAIVSGSGYIDAFGLSTPEANVRISGSGSIFTAPSEYLDAVISGSGNVHYRGNPEVNATVSGSGSVRHGN